MKRSSTGASRREHVDRNDPLDDLYRSRITESSTRLASQRAGRTALLVVDLQYLDAEPGFGMFSHEGRVDQFYFRSLRGVVLPNVVRLQAAFRAAGAEIIHTRIQSLTRDGRDRSRGHKRLGLHAAPGSREAEFLPEVAPRGDEIVINKTASGVFAATNLEYVLRNLSIEALMVCGVYTNECVSTTVRDGCDRGFHVTLVEDACTAVTAELHDASVRSLEGRYARVVDTDAAIRHLRQLRERSESK